MVRAELKSVLLWTLGAPSREVARGEQVEDPEHFGLGAQVFIGTVGAAATDSFDVMIATGSWLAERQHEDWEGFAPVG